MFQTEHHKRQPQPRFDNQAATGSEGMDDDAIFYGVLMGALIVFAVFAVISALL